ncbi:hypothetical protein MRB53_033651 [Persea americana]|uniref:Uncharacterized protein n=1 Tax=Persea americana TaxID=3435 RepID=A0ACC2KV31_PERAE|nr:hypothetical protein MRB53_033651 [Persea americana]
MDPKANKFVTSRDVVFDEVSSWYPAPTHTSTVTNALNDDQENLEIFPETSAQRSDVSPVTRMDPSSSDDAVATLALPHNRKAYMFGVADGARHELEKIE